MFILFLVLFVAAFVSSQVPYRELYSTALLMAGAYCTGQDSARRLFSEAAVLLKAAPASLPPVTQLREGLEELANYLEVTIFMIGYSFTVVKRINLW